MYTKRDQLLDGIAMASLVPLFWGAYVLAWAVFGG
jgi:hypothetical protein